MPRHVAENSGVRIESFARLRSLASPLLQIDNTGSLLAVPYCTLASYAYWRQVRKENAAHTPGFPLQSSATSRHATLYQLGAYDTYFQHLVRKDMRRYRAVWFAGGRSHPEASARDNLCRHCCTRRRKAVVLALPAGCLVVRCYRIRCGWMPVLLTPWAVYIL